MAAATVGAAALGGASYRPAPTLLSEGVVVGPGGGVVPVAPGAAVRCVPGTRVPEPSCDPFGLDGAERDALVESALSRREGAVLPDTPWPELVEDALRDLLALTGPPLVSAGLRAEPTAEGRPGDVCSRPAAGSVPGPGTAASAFPVGAVVAGPVTYWRYTWPRDAAFAAVALGRVGLGAEASAVLEHLAGLLGEDGSFEARYDARGEAPDARPAQGDGPGWLLWAASELRGADGAAPLGPAASLALGRAAARLLQVTDTPSHLPSAFPDYWELEERVLTLGTAAPTLLGLESAALLARGDGGALADAPEAARLEERAGVVREAIVRGFAPQWGRHVRSDDVDAAVALALPPFLDGLGGALDARRAAAARMARPSGGLAPGSSWRTDGVSWTPETALMAWSGLVLAEEDASLGEEGRRLMSWLEAHRTAMGSLPEKVLADGSPAGPAPLSWTGALVILAACEAAA